MKLIRIIVLNVYLLLINSLSLLLYYHIFTDFLKFWAYHKLNYIPVTYDYVVVGSGAAGAIVAKRLAQENVTVLILEAGANTPPLFSVPSLGLLLQNSRYDWQYRTEPQNMACKGLHDHISFWPMGRAVGGSSRLNNMVYVRGHPQDYNNWGFNYTNDVLPYFLRLENIIEVNGLNYKTILADSFLQTTINNVGFSLPKVLITGGKRWTPVNLLFDKKNVIIHPNAIVEKILFKSNFEAMGVKYWFGGNSYIARARKGVVLSAGVIGSPKILLQSGVGNFQDLQGVGVTPRINLPQVGLNLHDHVGTGMDLVLLNTTLAIGIEEMLSPLSAINYFLKGQGPWTTVGCENNGFGLLNVQEQPQLQFMVLPIGLTTDSGVYLRKLSGITDKTWSKYFSQINTTSITILPLILHPKSRGYVRLRNNNYKSPPLINPNFLTNDYDVNILIEGVRIIKDLVNSPQLRKFGARLNPTPFPGCEGFAFDTNPYWDCYVRHLTLTVYHPVGTCEMGVVTDFEFRVKGANKLYVVDGSVLPSSTSGNIMGPIMMMAEMAADFIKYHNYLNLYCCNILEIFVPNRICYR